MADQKLNGQRGHNEEMSAVEDDSCPPGELLTPGAKSLQVETEGFKIALPLPETIGTHEFITADGLYKVTMEIVGWKDQRCLTSVLINNARP